MAVPEGLLGTCSQLQNSTIKHVRDSEEILTTMLSNYYSQLLQLHRSAPDVPLGRNESEMLSSPLVEQLEAEQRSLATDGSKFRISEHMTLVADNTPFDGLALGIVGNLLEADNAFLGLMLDSYSRSPDEALQKETDFWAGFPATVSKTTFWYGELATREKPEEVCLILKVRNLYPAVIRPGELATALMSINSQEGALHGDVIGWYLAKKGSGEILRAQEIPASEWRDKSFDNGK